MFQVQKKDGSLENFDRNKVVAGVLKSGGTNEEAEKVASEVETGLSATAVNNVVQSSEIHSKVLEALRGVNPTVASSFESYQKPA